MGIEKFFNSLKRIYGTNIITPIIPSTHLQDKNLLIDFNLIVHIMSQIVSSSLRYLYHIYLSSNIRPDVFTLFKKNINDKLNNLSTSDSFILESNMSLPDINTESETNKYMKTVEFKNLTIDQIDDSFFRIFDESNLDQLIIHKIANYVSSLIYLFPQLKYLYIAVDGVPLYAKMLEQKKRRFIGYLFSEARDVLLEYYKKDLDIDGTLDKKIYYNHYKFELRAANFRFNRNKISVGTKFMTSLEKYLNEYLTKTHQDIDVVIDSYNNPNEGEKKIILEIIDKKLKDVSIYSSDADVILLSLLESNKCNIHIIRHDQQTDKLECIIINQLADVINKYMQHDDVIRDIVMLFTILGNDFMPKLDIIDTNRHIKTILSAYKKLRNETKMGIFGSNGSINFEQFYKFFIFLRARISQVKQFKKHITWQMGNDQIINSNAISYYRHLFNMENLVEEYDPPEQLKNITTDMINKCVTNYIQGFIWLVGYYINHDMKYKFWFYNSKISPTIPQLLYGLHNINNILYSTIINGLNDTLVNDNNYFSPIQQLIFISPNNISSIIDTMLLNNKSRELINNYITEDLGLIMNNGKINIFDYIICKSGTYASKCELKHRTIKTGKEILATF